MNKKSVIFVNIILFILICLVIVNCSSNKKASSNSGYIKEIDTLFEEKTNKVLSIERTFFRKLATVHNGVLEFKQPQGETYVIVLIKDPETKNFSLFVIEDFNEFINNANYIMNNKEVDLTKDVDVLKSTSMRKSLSFEKGIFIRKEANRTPSVIFDLSEQSLKELEEAYSLYLNE